MTSLREIPRPATGSRATAPVRVFAAIGAVLLALELVTLGAWVFGSTFHRIPSGPDVPPQWMRTSLVVGQGVLTALMLFCFYWYLVRPWLRERVVTLDGLLCVIVFIASFFDMLSVFGQHWFTYNAYLVNFGSVMTEIPGVTSLNGRGVGQPFPVLFMPALYVAGVVPLAILGCTVLRRLRDRFGLTSPQLVLACLAMMLVVDVVGEGLILIPLGFWSYEGSHLAVFGDHYWKYPFQEAVQSACFYTAITCVRFFVDDAGATFAERGLGSLGLRGVRRTVVRFLAVLAFVHLGFLFLYHVPQALWGINSTAWPRDAQDKSYLTNGICGPRVDRACPGPGVPNARPGSPYLNYHGRLVPARNP